MRARWAGWAWLLAATAGCAGELVVEINEDGTVTGPACFADTDCPDASFRCIDDVCVQGDGDGPGGGGTGDPTLELGEECESAFECLSGRCEAVGSTQICTTGCSDVCNGGLVCFESRCVPPGFCESDSGTGVGPGCTNSVCRACDENATCVSTPGGFECRCNDGFSGSGTSCAELLCQTNLCQNGGQCVQVGDQEACSCADDDNDSQPDYVGDLCETPIQNCPIFATPSNNPCENGGVCTNTAAGLTCDCAATGYTGDRCDTDVDECNGANPCENGGTCVNEVGGFDCDCPPDFVGETCTIDVSGGCAAGNPCSNGGVCDDTSGQVQCICAGTGFTGDTCTLPIDDCDPNPCENGATCTDGINDYSCDCPLGFAGKDCDEAAACATDVDCAGNQFCEDATSTCQPDGCDPTADRRCQGNTVVACPPNGSEEVDLFTCAGRPGAFSSACIDPANDDAYCTCEDDWDCPADTVCNVDRCEGTGEPATCRLDPEPFEAVLPVNEITWGGKEQAQGAVDLDEDGAINAPFPESSQVVVTPIVANLDDDNGDGLIDERDFPEILFQTFCDSEYRRRGVLRAIHGGPSAKRGKDYFAVCGDLVWSEGEALNSKTCGCSDPDLNPTSTLAVADLDYDGVPEIVSVVSYRSGDNNRDGRIRIHDNRGVVLFTSGNLPLADNEGGNLQNNKNSAVTIANLDGSGLPELVVGNDAFTLRLANRSVINPDTGATETREVPVIDRHFAGTGLGETGLHAQGPISCAADVLGDEDLEIIAGSTIYALPRPPVTCPGGTAEEQAFCNDELHVVQQLEREGGNPDGFCAIADVLGASVGDAPGRGNPPDAVPEVILIHNGRLLVWQREGNAFRSDPVIDLDLELGSLGGAPNVDDFDGDGFPEIGTAFRDGYAMMDLQSPTAECPAWPGLVPSTTRWLAPGTEVDATGDPTGNAIGANTARNVSGSCDEDADCGGVASGFACNEELGACVCEHNGWRRGTQDGSSRVTGSSVFDFNGDGAAEVIYNDECYFRVYEGLTGNVLFIESSESRTRVEYPVVADADNDGNAEILFAVSNESNFCASRASTNINTEPGLANNYNNGIESWSDSSDLWVAARRIWNQHAYHVTNITENAQVPRIEPKGWVETNSRFYNTYRSNPRNFGVAPDLEVTAVQVVGGAGGCGGAGGGAGQIVSQVSNIGDLRVGGNVIVGFLGDWGAGFVTLLRADGTPLRTTITNTLEPRDAVFLTTNYDPAWNGESSLPNQVRVIVDATYDETSDTIAFDGGRERECDETNNDRVVTAGGGASLPDLTVTQLTTPQVCGTAPPISVTVTNAGSEPAPAGTVVRVFAGDPNQGGTPIDEFTLPAALPAGALVTRNVTPTPFPQCRPVRIFVVVDPDNAVEECNDGNNQRSATRVTTCCDSGG